MEPFSPHSVGFAGPGAMLTLLADRSKGW